MDGPGGSERRFWGAAGKMRRLGERLLYVSSFDDDS